MQKIGGEKSGNFATPQWQGVLPEEVTGENGLYSYVCPISGTQVLAVEVYVQGDTYEILRWQAESAAAWQADENLPVWRGE